MEPLKYLWKKENGFAWSRKMKKETPGGFCGAYKQQNTAEGLKTIERIAFMFCRITQISLTT